jgi:hypothetical protein
MIFFSRSRKESRAKLRRKSKEALKDSMIDELLFDHMIEGIRDLRNENIHFRNVISSLLSRDADVEKIFFEIR